MPIACVVPATKKSEGALRFRDLRFGLPLRAALDQFPIEHAGQKKPAHYLPVSRTISTTRSATINTPITQPSHIIECIIVAML